MNSASLAQSAYSKAASIAPSEQDVEYRAFAEVTRRLSRHAGGGAGDFAGLVDALHVNKRLWTLLAADVSDDQNGLPAPLRAQIFYLFEFTRQHSGKVLNGEADATILVEINTAVMRGLRGTQLTDVDGPSR